MPYILLTEAGADFEVMPVNLPRSEQHEDVCGAAVYLLSPLARFVTGQLLAVNRGFVMH